jgi:hypothetical protein
MFESNITKYKTYIAVQANPSPPQPLRQFTLLEIIFGGGLLAILTSLGAPKLLAMLAQHKVEEGKADRRREDSIYDSLVKGYQENQRQLIVANSTMMSNQVSQTSELFQLANTLALEIKEMRNAIKALAETNNKAASISHKAVEGIQELLYKTENIETLIEQQTTCTIPLKQ